MKIEDLEMKIKKAHQNGNGRAYRDLGLIAAFSASGITSCTENRSGIIYFVFKADANYLSALEDQYWSGQLCLPAKELYQHLKSIKDRLYALKLQAATSKGGLRG